MGRPTVVLDFDGVIHSCTSGYIGADKIPDPVVPGIKAAIDELRTGYRVVVVSARCASVEGCCAVRRYLRENGIEVDNVTAGKPPALCYIDDRAIRFDGNASSIPEKVRNFKTWLEGGQNDSPVSHLRPCEAEEFIPYQKQAERRVLRGWFHEWGCDYFTEEGIPGNFTTAIIEADNGRIFRALPESVRFLDRAKPTDAPEEG